MADEKHEKTIGIVAGAGPFASLDLLRKILGQTLTANEQDHLSVVSLSQPCRITDRTEYLSGRTDVNPARAIVEQLRTLEQAGAAVAAVCCNTVHAPEIFNVILDGLHKSGSGIMLLHMISEVATFMSEHHPQIRRLGLLSTLGTYRSRVFPSVLEPAGFTVISPDTASHEKAIHDAVYDPVFGIKAHGSATEKAMRNLLREARHLQQAGAEALVLGCTEIPLAIREPKLDNMIVVDPTLVLARALIREANPEKLKPLCPPGPEPDVP